MNVFELVNWKQKMVEKKLQPCNQPKYPNTLARLIE